MAGLPDVSIWDDLGHMSYNGTLFDATILREACRLLLNAANLSYSRNKRPGVPAGLPRARRLLAVGARILWNEALFIRSLNVLRHLTLEPKVV
jgi:hypothetical protein